MGLTLAVPAVHTGGVAAEVVADAVFDHAELVPHPRARTRKYSVVLGATPLFT